MISKHNQNTDNCLMKNSEVYLYKTNNLELSFVYVFFNFAPIVLHPVCQGCCHKMFQCLYGMNKW